MKRRRRILIPILLLLVILAGCTTEHGQEDIEDYLKKTYAMDDAKVSKDRTERTGEDGYTDYLWDVTAGGVKFHVLDDYYWGGESLTNNLFDDYKDVMLKSYFDATILPDFTLEESEEQGLCSNRLIGEFQTKEELTELFAELEDFREYVAAEGYDLPGSFSYTLQMQSPIRDNIPEHVVDDGDTAGKVTGMTETDLEDAITTYTLAYTDYHFSDLQEKFTTSEIAEAVRSSRYQIAIVKGESKTFYTDLCGSRFGYGVSFGTLYEILKREGFFVTGNSEHYSFSDGSGNSYEISYDFLHADGDASGDGHYYYLKNGVPVEMDEDFYTHFTEKQVRELCGLELYVGKPE